MKKLALIFGLLLASIVPAYAQNPNCGLNNDQTAYIPSQYFGVVTVSGPNVTWSSGAQFITSWTGTIYLYTPNEGGLAYTISSVPSTTSLVLTTSPGNGTYKYSFNINWDTFVPPAVGGHYVDPLTGCWIYRETNNAANSTTFTHNYNTITALNSNDTFVLIEQTNASSAIVTAPAYTGATPGTIVVPSNFRTYNGGDLRWDYTNPNVLWYVYQSSIYTWTITGLPGCITTNNCTLTSAVVATFGTGTGSTGNGYTSVGFNAASDFLDACHIQVNGHNPVSKTIDIDVYNTCTSTNTIWYTTTCVDSGDPLGEQECDGGLVHKINLTPDWEPVITFEVNGLGSEEGTIWYHGTPGSATQTHLQNATAHLDVGLDTSGVEEYVNQGIATGFGTDPCPAGQWTGQSTGKGNTMSYFTDPTNASSTSTCTPNVDWASVELSDRSTPSRPWFVGSYFDARNPGPEYFTTTTSKYVAPTCTQVYAAIGGTCWYPWEDEVLMVKTTTNMNTVGFGALATVYRLAQARSRSADSYNGIPRASLSRDGNYIVFDSTMANDAGCTNQAGYGCVDVYVLTAPNAGPLLSSVPLVSFSPTSLSFGNQNVSTTSAQQVVTLTNTGTASLTISSVALTTGTQFALATPGSGSDCRTVGTVAASASCNIAVTFTPTSTGAKSDTVSVTDNASGSPHTFGVSGTGVNAGASTATGFVGGAALAIGSVSH